MSDKTEDPTPKRLRKAQEEGDSGQSSALSSAVAFLVGIFSLPAALLATRALITPALHDAFNAAAMHEPEVVVDSTRLTFAVLGACMPLLLVVGVTAAVVSVVQTGGGLATKKLAPKLDALDVFKGLKNLIGMSRVFSVLRALATALVVAYLAKSLVQAHLPDLARLTESPQHLPRLVEELTRSLLKRAALVGLVLALVDVLVTRHTRMKRLRMSKDEVKREHKESDGDPQLKAQREKLHHELLAQATLGAVKQARVVVMNPTHIACALRYDEDEGDSAPVLVAQGEGQLAKRIAEAARAYGIPVLRDVPLARALFELEVGDEIPEALYEAVALVLREAAAELEPPAP